MGCIDGVDEECPASCTGWPEERFGGAGRLSCQRDREMARKRKGAVRRWAFRSIPPGVPRNHQARSSMQSLLPLLVPQCHHSLQPFDLPSLLGVRLSRHHTGPRLHLQHFHLLF